MSNMPAPQISGNDEPEENSVILSNAEFKLFASLRNFLYDHILLVNAKDSDVEEMAEEICSRFIREAARRLSAPATLPREPTEAMFIAAREWSRKYVGSPIGNRAATGCWQSMWDAAPQSAPASAAPRVGDDEPTKAMLIAGLDRGLAWMKEHGVDGLSPWQDYPRPVDTLKVVYAAMRGAALSAPPAASADEREELAKDIHEAEFGDPFDSLPEPEKEINRRIADRLSAAGYRKRQGVEAFEDVAKWCERNAQRTQDAVKGAFSEGLLEAAAHIRRLSALTKGPPDEA